MSRSDEMRVLVLVMASFLLFSCSAVPLFKGLKVYTTSGTARVPDGVIKERIAELRPNVWRAVR